MMKSPSAAAGLVVWYALIISRWVHSQFIAPSVQWWLDNVLSAAEESVLAWVRECFAVLPRLLNAIGEGFVAVFLRGRRVRAKKDMTRPSAWKAFWATSRSSTFNAVIEQEGLIASGSAKRTPSPEPLPHRRRGAKASKPMTATARVRSLCLYTITLPPLSWIAYLLPFVGPGSRGTRSSSAPPSPRPPRIKRSGSELFNQPSGFAVAEQMQRRRGFFEDTRLAVELGVAAVFERCHSLMLSVFWMTPTRQHRHPHTEDGSSTHATDWVEGTNAPKLPTALPPVIAGRMGAKSSSSWEDTGVWTASDVILLSGYPLEEHVVTTSDGYVLNLQRIPRKDSKKVVFFQHGVLDTSLSWVSNGPQGSQAFAAYDRGADVWLGNSRANPPRAHVDPDMYGSRRYWAFSINEQGLEDIPAQLDFIHAIKTAELTAAVLRPGHGLAGSSVVSMGMGTAGRNGAHEADAGDYTPGWRPTRHHRSGSDSALTALHSLALAAEPYSRGADAQPPNEERIREWNAAAAADGSPLGRKGAGSSPNLATPGAVPGFDAGDSGSQARRSSLDKFAQLWRYRSAAPGSSAADELAGQGRANGTSSGSHPARAPAAVRPTSAGPRSFSLAVPADGVLGASDDDETVDAAGPQAAQAGACTEESAGRREKPIPPSIMHRMRSMGAAGLDAFPLPDLQPLDLHDASSGHSIGGGSPRQFPLMHTGSGNGVENMPPLGSDVLLTPDRVCVNGKEQAPADSAPSLPPAVARVQEWLSAAEALKGGGTAHNGSAATIPTPTPEDRQLYSMQAVAHSLGGAALLIHAVMCKMMGRPHRLSRLVLLSPAGFHTTYPMGATPAKYVLPVVMSLLNRFRPGVGMPAYIPSSLLRYITFKLTVDLQQIPALAELTHAALRLLLNGDKSEWDRALQMPHYSYTSMPAISLHTGTHLIQLMWSGAFNLYDYGSAAANTAHYGRPTPINVADNYGLLAGLPVDLVAGKEDGIVGTADVLKHYDAMKAAGLRVSYKELDAGHLDLSFAVKDEVQHYVLSRLQL